MQEGAKLFLGTHDFTTFRSSHCQATSPIKTIETFNVVLAPYMVRQKNGFETSNGFEQEESFGWGKRIDIYVSAKSFLQHQIRSCVGALKLLGEGKWHKTDLRQALIAKNRAQCPPLAPACGLYLVKVDYA